MDSQAQWKTWKGVTSVSRTLASSAADLEGLLQKLQRHGVARGRVRQDDLQKILVQLYDGVHESRKLVPIVTVCVQAVAAGGSRSCAPSLGTSGTTPGRRWIATNLASPSVHHLCTCFPLHSRSQNATSVDRTAAPGPYAQQPQVFEEPYNVARCLKCWIHPPLVRASPTFSDLPTDIQSRILELHLEGQHGKSSSSSKAVRMVCRSFDAHVQLHNQARQRLTVTPSVHTAALLPYSPCLSMVVVDSHQPLPFSRFLHRMLDGSTPHLVSLTLRLPNADVCALAAAVASKPQLQELSIYVLCDDAQETQPGLELPALPYLRKLSIEQPIVHFREQVMPGIDRIWDELPVGLGNLSTMPLTSLNCQLGEFSLGDDEEREQQDETDPTLGMVVICDALGCLTELRELTTHFWTTGAPGARDCWQALARAMPTLRHLTRLELLSLLVSAGGEGGDEQDPQCLVAFTAGLSNLTALRSLALTGHKQAVYNQDWCETESDEEEVDFREASVPLASALGSLAGLTQLKLANLQGVLALKHCYLRLGALTALRSLELDLKELFADGGAQSLD